MCDTQACALIQSFPATIGQCMTHVLPYTGNRTQSQGAGYGGRGVTFDLAGYIHLYCQGNQSQKERNYLSIVNSWMLMQEMTSTVSEAGYV